MALAAPGPEALEEICLIFPDTVTSSACNRCAKLIPKGSQQVHLADRLSRNERQPLEYFCRPD